MCFSEVVEREGTHKSGLASPTGETMRDQIWEDGDGEWRDMGTIMWEVDRNIKFYCLDVNLLTPVPENRT